MITKSNGALLTGMRCGRFPSQFAAVPQALVPPFHVSSAARTDDATAAAATKTSLLHKRIAPADLYWGDTLQYSQAPPITHIARLNHKQDKHMAVTMQ